MGIIIRQSIKGSLVSYLGIVIGTINTLWLFTYFFTAEQYGLTKIILSFALILVQFSKVGVVNTLIKYYPSYKNQVKKLPVFMGLFVLTPLIAFTLIYVAIMTFKPHILEYYSNKSALFVNYFEYALLVSFFFLALIMFEAYSRVNLRIVVPSLIKYVVVRLLTLLEIVAFSKVWISFSEFIFLFCANYIVFFLATLSYAYFLKPFRLSFKLNVLSYSEIKVFYKYSALLFLGSTAAVLIQNIDVLMISSMVGLEGTAIYTVSFFMATLIEIPRRQLSKISSTVISESWHKNEIMQIKNIYQSSSINQFILGSLIFILIWVNADDIFVLIPKRELYEQGKWVIFYIGLGRIIDMLAGVNSEIIKNSPKYYFDLISMIVLVVLCVILNLYLIPLYGIEGAAIATCLSICFFNLIKFIFLWVSYGLQPFTKQSLKAVIFCLVLGVLFLLWPWHFEELFMSIFNIALKSLLLVMVFGFCVYKMALSREINNLINVGLSKAGLTHQ